MRVWIQRGHCFRTSGSTGTTGEQDYVDDVADRAARLLVDRGHRVHVALADTYIVGDWDLFVALHCDGSTSPAASGASVGYRTTKGQRAARLWKRRFDARGWPYGFRDDNYTPALAGYYGTGWAKAEGIGRAFVLEHGFLTNPDLDRAWLHSAEGREAAALALADVVVIEAGGEPIDTTPEPMEDEDLMKHGDKGLYIRAAKQTLRACLREYRTEEGLSLDQDRDLQSMDWEYDHDMADLVRYLVVRILKVDPENTDGHELYASQLVELARRTERTRERVPPDPEPEPTPEPTPAEPA